ncbi:MAG TPA: hypothetical protein VNO51_03270 [Ilumatobacteraceae bacterium]|nr:hypothetical protein [Ilumatobacteraceae bacterium]
MDEATLQRLYATVPTDFVAARNAVVKEMRRAKERDEAALVAALRRPDWTDWALNVAAAEKSEAVDEFARAASDVRDAQTAAIEGRDGPDVRTALRTLRERTTEVIRAAVAALEGAGRPPGTAELTARLSEIAGNAAACEQLRTGVLGSGDPDVSNPFAGLEPAAGPRQRRDAPAKRAPGAASKPAVAVAGKADKRAAESEPRVSAAERQRIRREREQAERAHRTAVRELARADDDVEKATVAVAIAREKLADAERQQAEANAHRLAVAEKLATAEEAVAVLEQ